MKSIGDPAEIAESLKQFQDTALLLSSTSKRMIEHYPKQWIALYDGAVRARASSLQSLLNELDAANIPRSAAVVRYIDNTQRTMIL